jgi:hypothetical protein
MVNQSTSTGNQDTTGDKDTDKSNAAMSKLQTELLQAVLETETYPWLVDEMAQPYSAQTEAAGETLEISDEEATQGWQALSAQLDQQFARVGQLVNSASLSERLQQKFATRLPAEMLARIGEKAQQLFSGGESVGQLVSQSVLEQMMACVQDVLSYVADEDLRVMARPMAMAMRGNSADEFVDATIKSVRTDDWAALSPIEQARLGLAAARYALSQAENQD